MILYETMTDAQDGGKLLLATVTWHLAERIRQTGDGQEQVGRRSKTHGALLWLSEGLFQLTSAEDHHLYWLHLPGNFTDLAGAYKPISQLLRNLSDAKFGHEFKYVCVQISKTWRRTFPRFLLGVTRGTSGEEKSYLGTNLEPWFCRSQKNRRTWGARCLPSQVLTKAYEDPRLKNQKPTSHHVTSFAKSLKATSVQTAFHQLGVILNLNRT